MNRRLSFLFVTHDALAAALRLQPGMKIIRVADGLDEYVPVDRVRVWIEDTTGERVREVREGEQILVVRPDSVTEP